MADQPPTARPPLVLTQTAIKREGAQESFNDQPIFKMIEWLTEERYAGEPELTLLAFHVLRAIVTGYRAERLRELAREFTDPPNVKHTTAMSVLAHITLPIGPASKPAEWVARMHLRPLLASLDSRFEQCPDEDLIWAILQISDGAAGDPQAPRLPWILANLCAKCGAFDVAQDGSEGTIERARSMFVKSRARFK